MHKILYRVFDGTDIVSIPSSEARMHMCKRCGHSWMPHNTIAPKRCPRCQSPLWARTAWSDCPCCRYCPDHGLHVWQKTAKPTAELEDTPTVTMIQAPGQAEPIPPRRRAIDAVDVLMGLSDEEPVPSRRRPAKDAPVEELILSEADQKLADILHGRAPTADQGPIPSRRPAKDAKRREFTDIELAEIIHHEFTPPTDRQMTTADQERMRIMQAMYAHDDAPRRPGLSDEEVDRIFGSSPPENNT